MEADNTKRLLDKWKNSDKKKSLQTSIVKAPPGLPIPLTSGQQRLWFLQRLLPENPVYNYSENFVLTGELNILAFAHCLKQIFENNSILRSTYSYVNEQPVQLIHDGPEIKLNMFDLSKLSTEDKEKQKHDLLLSDARLPFSLDVFPLVRTTLIKLSDSEHVFLMTMHHIIFDKWSMDLFLKKLSTAYRNFFESQDVLKNDSDLQFSDYAFWQRSRVVYSDQLAYWKTKLGGEIPFLDLPTDYPQPARPTYKGTSYRSQFSNELSTRVLELCKTLDTTPYVLLLSVYYVLLYKYSGQKDILVGSPISHRTSKVLENMIGFFDETVVLRTRVVPEMTFSNFVTTVKENTLKAFANKDVPFEALVKELSPQRSLSVNPFFRVMFIYHSVQKSPHFGSGLELSHSFFNPGVSKFDLTLYIANDNGQLSSGFEYASDIFKETTIIQLQEHLTLFLETVTKNPEQNILEVDMLTVKEKQFFFENTNQNSNFFQEFQGIHHIIESVGKISPQKTAVTFKNESITYKTLNERADALAATILNHTKNRKEIIGLCIDRSLEMIIGMLGILKAGCGYLPLDPDYPKDRLDFILKDAECNLLITQTFIKKQYEESGVQMLYIDSNEIINDHKDFNPPIIKEDDIAYVIYTSGSTGWPKGVPISHKNIINSTAGRLDFYPENPDVFLLMSSISFDSSKAGIFWTLCTGGNLVITEKKAEQDIAHLEALIQKNSVTHTLMLPSLYKLILEHGSISNLVSLKAVIVAGEACLPELRNLHFEKLETVNLYNEYGPTEASVWCTAFRIKKTDADIIPIGKPVANAKMYLLNETLDMVPFGAVGDMYVGGPGLTKGYINKPELNKKVFLNNPFNNNSDGRLYKTGDRGRYDQEGNIEFLGRIDEQVKIRGHRIELDEVEKAMRQIFTNNKIVVLVEEKNAIKRLISFVEASEPLDLLAIKATLKEILPDFMIPSAIYPIAEFPFLPNGKIDKKSLLGIERHTSSSPLGAHELPTSETGAKLLNIWQQVLGLSTVSVNDNFFEIGGDSIQSIQMLAMARKEGIIITPNQIFEYQTIKELEDFISKNKDTDEQWDYLVPFRKTGSKKPLFCLHAGGGNVFFYKGLIDYIDPNRPLYGIQASGMYGKKHKMHSTISEMANDYIAAIKTVQPDGPYNIVVYCFSASVGHEMAIKFKNSGEKFNLIVMDTMAKPWSLNTPNRIKIRVIGFVNRLLKNPVSTIKNMISIRLNKASSRHKVHGGNGEKTLEDLQENLERLSLSYQWEVFDGKISLILTEKAHGSLNKETINSWQEFAGGGVTVLRTKGHHNDLFNKENLPYVTKIIEECIVDN
ncbi:amino acid adenylation domain-containing protein [Gelidibacter salicanalis]|uniref:Amino acid adenylation domain-containing protein n=1 Tax=Gelidibacter salicanalis TaxID=291193 RepID=A0A5C7ADN8_9FLAO|nr:non-ribosomal peptide synthetase [Gelidibacter salicanalis]TXE05979.1 amino acid adenylation domain-containing protein [Gelidibacter salicanalis]